MIELWAKSVIFKTSLRLADQAGMSLKKSWSFDLEILEIYPRVSCK